MHSPEDEDVIVDASNMNFMHVPAEAVVGTSLGCAVNMGHWSWLYNLVGGDWNMTFIFPYIGNVIIPID